MHKRRRGPLGSPCSLAQSSGEGDLAENETAPNSDEIGEQHHSEGRRKAIDCLEKMALSVIDQLINAISAHDPITLFGHSGSSAQDAKDSIEDSCPISAKSKARIVLSLSSRRRKRDDQESCHSTRSIVYPRRSAKDSGSKQLAQVLRVVEIAHEALVSNTAVTKRDIYYRNVDLFGSQTVVDKIVDDIASSFSLHRSDLNIRASPKGLFCGSVLRIHTLNGDFISGIDTSPCLIPPFEEISRLEFCAEISWVLVVEKEAVFQTLCNLDFASHPQLPGPGVILTGKGYPDIATRQLVVALSQNVKESVPILVLVDSDAYGLDIAFTYKCGSASMWHERDILAANRMKCIGVFGTELIEMGIDKDLLLPITVHDEKKALTMLRNRTGMPKDWRRELTHMLHSRCKAEIEVIQSLAPSTFCSRHLLEIPTVNERTNLLNNPLAAYTAMKIMSQLDVHSESPNLTSV